MSFNNRPETPAEAQFYLRLVTEKELPTRTIHKFYETISTYAPQNVLSIYETTSPEGNPAQSVLLHRIMEDKKHEYELPLVRNLTPNEIVEVVKQLEYALTENDFLFETSTFDEECCINEDHNDLYVEPEISEQIANKFAERAHTCWLNERIEKGWRHGPQRDDNQKTHPLMKPWSQLPEEHKSVDLNSPQLLLDLLEEYGYTIISHSELNELIEASTKKR